LRITFASMRCFAKYEQNMGERSATSEPHRSCYVSWARNKARVQRGVAKRRSSKNIFIKLSLISFFLLLYNKFDFSSFKMEEG